MIPIIGARNVGQLRQNLACLDHKLTGEYIKRLNKVSHIELGFPHDFLEKEYIQNLVYGGTYDKIDGRRK